MNGLIDLHMHSTASDGTLSPSELAGECFSLGVRYAALTDHDTADGQAEFADAAHRLGIKTVTGIEMNIAHHCELHILGYGFDPEYPELKESLLSLKQERRNRAEKITSVLTSNGYPIEFARVLEIAKDGVIGRPHIAEALVEKGYALSIQDAFDRFLCRGGPGYVKRRQFTSGEAISLIARAGGVTVLAHPGNMTEEDYPALISRLKKEGISGIEAFYTTHTDEQCRFFLSLARENGLFVTCGTDYHGTRYNEKLPGQEKRGIQEVLPTIKNLMANC